MITSTISRFLFRSHNPYLRQTFRLSSAVVSNVRSGYVNEQMEYIKLVTENKIDDWGAVRSKLLSMPGSLNEKNISGVMLKLMLNNKRLDVAKSYATYLENTGEMYNLGVINGILSLYYEMAKEKPLGDDERQFILNSYKRLYEKHEVLDSTTSEKLLHALCAINEWKKALKVLDDIHVSSNPTFSAYNTMIATLFNLDMKKEALKLIEKSLRNQRSLKHTAYEAWIDYVIRHYKDKNRLVKYLDEICMHVSKNCAVIPEITAQKMRKTYAKLGWHARYTKIRKQDGQCVYCKSTLDCLKLSEEEFQLLQKSIKDKLIVGSDILLKTSPGELNRFLKFVEQTAPYDVVLDGLNICYASGRLKADKVGQLTFVVEHFRQQNKKILIIGRKHMSIWPNMKYILSKTCNFLTDNVSQDDPYFISAAILSGAHTDVVSKDLLRGHRFQMQDEQLRHLFQRWQWQHQWKLFINRSGSLVMQPPLPVTPCAQKKDSSWHLPFEREEATAGQVRDGTPDWSSWLCLQPVIR